MADLTITPEPDAPSNSALKLLPAKGGSYALRRGFAMPADGGSGLYQASSSACPLNGGLGDDGYQVAAADGGCWILDWPAGGADLRVWGIKFDNSTDNSTTLSKAIAAHNVTGGILRVPGGIALFSAAPAAITKGGIVLEGTGVPGINNCSDITDAKLTGSILRATTAFGSGDIFTIATEDRAVFRDVMVDYQQSSSCANAMRSSGAAFAVVGANGTYARNPTFENVELRYQYDGIRFDFANGWQISGLIALDWKNDAVKDVNTDPSTDYGDWLFQRSILWNVDATAGTAGRAGFEFLRGGSGAFVNNKINGVQYCYLLNRTNVSGFTATATHLTSNNSCENYTQAGIALLQASPGADFAVFSAHNWEFSTFSSFANPTKGDIFAGTGTPGGGDAKWIRGISLIGNQHTNGYTMAGGAAANVDIEDGLSVTIIGEKGSNNGVASGPPLIKVAGNASGCRLSGNDVYNNAGSFVYGDITGCNPTVSSCGTSPSVLNSSTDETWAITVGSGASPVTSCTVTFNEAYTGNNPVCVFATNQNGGTVSVNALSPTGVTFTQTDMRGWIVYAHCKQGG